jgi:hypothetical protein
VSVIAREGLNSSRLLSGAAMFVTIVAVTPKSAGVFPVRTNRFATKVGFAGPLLEPLVPPTPKAWWQLAQVDWRIGCTLHAKTDYESCAAAERSVAPL